MACASRQDVEINFLLEKFFEDELRHEGYLEAYFALKAEISPPHQFGEANDVDIWTQSLAHHSTSDGYESINFLELWVNIREIADKFNHSCERNHIHELADEVDLHQITLSAFHKKLNDLFKNSRDNYRLVSLFYFCSDIIIRCVKEELDSKIGSKIWVWTQQFIYTTVYKWVSERGSLLGNGIAEEDMEAAEDPTGSVFPPVEFYGEGEAQSRYIHEDLSVKDFQESQPSVSLGTPVASEAAEPCGCRSNCLSKFTSAERNYLSAYPTLFKEKKEKEAFFMKLVTLNKTKKRSGRGKKFRDYKYKIRNNKKEIQVCKAGFMKLYNIDLRQLNKIHAKLRKEVSDDIENFIEYPSTSEVTYSKAGRKLRKSSRRIAHEQTELLFKESTLSERSIQSRYSTKKKVLNIKSEPSLPEVQSSPQHADIMTTFMNITNTREKIKENLNQISKKECKNFITQKLEESLKKIDHDFLEKKKKFVEVTDNYFSKLLKLEQATASSKKFRTSDTTDVDNLLEESFSTT